MREVSDDILADIDATVTQLVENAEALKSAKMSHYFDHEIDVLERTQESLFARLMHRQALLEMDQREKTLESVRKEAVVRKVVEYAKVFKSNRRSQKWAKPISKK